MGDACGAVETRRLSKWFGGGDARVTALDAVDLTIPAGSFTAITGKSGSGKSTLLSLMGGLDEPSDGEVVVFGRKLAGLSRDELAAIRRQEIGYVFQEYNLLQSLTVLENAYLPLELDGVGRRDARRAGLDALTAVGLRALEKRYPSELSGGQRQRVAIARALVGKRRLLLADEPTGALDSATGDDILGLLRSLRDTGVTVAIVSHDPRVMSYADVEVTLADGRTVAQAEVRA